tara:strand:+ start:1269 stop:1895 length:627 start_codon:yes stop_codon:yes gene_type:complete
MYLQPSLINSPTANNLFLPKPQQFRASGPIEEYVFDALKPKKKLKEIKNILLPEKKKFIFKYGYKFNLKDRCVVCGMHHIWEAGEYLRPPIPLDHVTKGRPLRGTYCPKHAGVHKQMEMLQQQILADEHGLDFKAYIPRPRMPQMLKSGPLTNLTREDVLSLSSAGWVISPPVVKDNESEMAEAIRLIAEIEINTKRLYSMMNNTKEE